MAKTVRWSGIITLTLYDSSEGEATADEVMEALEEEVESLSIYVGDAGYSVDVQRDAKRA